MRSAPLRLLAVLCAVATSLLLVSCGDAKPDGEPHPTWETPVVAGAPAGSNADDNSFAINMITNYQQAVQLSEMVPDRSADQSIVEIAAGIVSSRRPDIELMKVLLVQWNADSTTPSDAGSLGATAPGAIDEATVARLQTLGGKDFDVLWLQSMVALDQGAVQIANVEAANGDNVDAVALAKRIVEKQQAEINHMQQILTGGG